LARLARTRENIRRLAARLIVVRSPSDPKSMLEECLAGTAQVIGWGFGQLLERGKLVDLFPGWHGERFPLFAFYPSRAHPPAKVRAFIDFCFEAAREL
jgi:DNA-binding transcriptional LysR family regulator